MKPLHPVTIASRNQCIDLAKAIIAAHPGHYGKLTPYWLALQLREIIRFCEDANIWDPADLALIVQAMYRPTPAYIPAADRDHALAIIANSAAAPEARARMVALALTDTLPPASPVNNTPRT
jgi:hypothetical protein